MVVITGGDLEEVFGVRRVKAVVVAVVHFLDPVTLVQCHFQRLIGIRILGQQHTGPRSVRSQKWIHRRRKPDLGAVGGMVVSHKGYIVSVAAANGVKGHRLGIGQNITIIRHQLTALSIAGRRMGFKLTIEIIFIGKGLNFAVIIDIGGHIGQKLGMLLQCEGLPDSGAVGRPGILVKALRLFRGLRFHGIKQAHCRLRRCDRSGLHCDCIGRNQSDDHEQGQDCGKYAFFHDNSPLGLKIGCVRQIIAGAYTPMGRNCDGKTLD